MRHHVVADYASADDVGENALGSVSVAYHGFAFFCADKHQHAVVVVLLSDAPMAEQCRCIVVDVVAVDRVDHHCHYFSRR